jgi:hypothetical protein
VKEAKGTVVKDKAEQLSYEGNIVRIIFNKQYPHFGRFGLSLILSFTGKTRSSSGFSMGV